MALPKILVATTIYDKKDYIFWKYYNNIKSLTYPNYDILLVDNSADKQYITSLKRKGVRNVVSVPRGRNSREAVANGMNKIREKVLKGGYDYWMSIESDLLPPKDIIERLLLHQKLCVGAMYVIGYDYSPTQPPRPCLFKTRKLEDGTTGTYNLDQKEGFEHFGQGLIKMHGMGVGTTLIHRSLLEQFAFWWEDSEIKHSDVYFYMDLHNNGYDVYLDSDIIIPHWNSDWRHVKDL